MDFIKLLLTRNMEPMIMIAPDRGKSPKEPKRVKKANYPHAVVTTASPPLWLSLMTAGLNQDWTFL